MSFHASQQVLDGPVWDWDVFTLLPSGPRRSSSLMPAALVERDSEVSRCEMHALRVNAGKRTYGIFLVFKVDDLRSCRLSRRGFMPWPSLDAFDVELEWGNLRGLRAREAIAESGTHPGGWTDASVLVKTILVGGRVWETFREELSSGLRDIRTACVVPSRLPAVTEARRAAIRNGYRSLAPRPPRQPRGPVLGYCGRCGRELTDALSSVRGYGPECWKDVIAEHPELEVPGHRSAAMRQTGISAARFRRVAAQLQGLAT